MDSVVASASRSFRFMVRNFRDFINLRCLMNLYFCLVRSRLEYASFIFYTTCHGQVQALWKVQRRFLKLLYFKSKWVYPARGYNHNLLLLKFDISSLEYRRFIISISFLYGLLYGYIDAAKLLSKINFRVPRQASRSDHILFYVPSCRTNINIKSPIHIMTSNSATGDWLDFNYTSMRTILNFLVR